jgi:WD40 repeat protein
VRFSPDGERFATAGWGDGTARVWHFGSGPAILRIKGPAQITSAAFSPHEEQVLTGTAQGSVLTWNAETGKEIDRFPWHPQEVFAAHYSEDAATALTASRDGTVMIHRGSKVFSFSAGDRFQDVSLSPDGTRVITVNLPRNAVEWDLRDDTPKRISVCCQPPEKTEAQWIDKLSFSPFDPRLVATIVGESTVPARITIWDRTDDGVWKLRNLREMRGIGNGRVRSFSKDGRFLLTAWSDQKARVYDTQTGKMMKPLEGHQNEVTSAVFSPSGYVLATGSVDGTVRLWDLQQDGSFASWGIIRTGDPVEEVDFNRDGTRFLALGMDGIVRIYDATPEGFLKLGCRMLHNSNQFEQVKAICSAHVADGIP